MKLYLKILNMIQKWILQLIKKIIILGFVIFSSVINAQGVKNVKQYYSDSDVGIFVQTTEIMDGFKFLFISLNNKRGNFFYDGHLIDEQLPNNAERKIHSVVIKTDMYNNYIDHYKYSSYNYHSVTHGEGILFFPIYDELIPDVFARYFIIGLDKNFNFVYKENVKGVILIQLKYVDKYLYIHTANTQDKLIVIGNDTIHSNFYRTHCTMKRDFKNFRNVWIAKASREDGAYVDLNVSSSGDAYIYSGFGGSLGGAVIIGQDSLLTSGADGFVYKLDADGNLSYMKQVYGNGSEAITDLIIDDNDNVYINIVCSGQSDEIRYDGITYPLANPFSGYRSNYIMRLNDEGQVTWSKSIGGQWVLFENIISMDDNTLLLCLNYTALKIDEIEESSGSSFVSLNNNTGDVENHYKLATNAKMNMYFGSQKVTSSIISFPISLLKEDDETITFMGKGYSSDSDYYNTISIYFDINFDELSNVEQNLEQEKLLVCPNPMFALSSLQISSEISFHMAQLYDINGKVVLEKREDNISEISLENSQTIVSGVYFLKLYSGNGVVTKKIIIH